jgi:hypothetical protein
MTQQTANIDTPAWYTTYQTRPPLTVERLLLCRPQTRRDDGISFFPVWTFNPFDPKWPVNFLFMVPQNARLDDLPLERLGQLVWEPIPVVWGVLDGWIIAADDRAADDRAVTTP